MWVSMGVSASCWSCYGGPCTTLYWLSHFCCATRLSFRFTIVFCLLPLRDIIRKLNIKFHFYADDTHPYVSITPGHKSNLVTLINCLDEIQRWISNNFLRLNDNKPEIILFCPHNFILNNLGSLSINVKPVARNVGVLCFDAQVKKVVQYCFLHLKIVSRIRPFLSSADLEKVIHCFHLIQFGLL